MKAVITGVAAIGLAMTMPAFAQAPQNSPIGQYNQGSASAPKGPVGQYGMGGAAAQKGPVGQYDMGGAAAQKVCRQGNACPCFVRFDGYIACFRHAQGYSPGCRRFY